MKAFYSFFVFLLLCCACVDLHAQAPQMAVNITASQLPYTLASAEDAQGGTGITYQWYKNGEAIAVNGTGKAYTIPATDYTGGAVTLTYTRASKCNECSTWQFSNPLAVAICTGAGDLPADILTSTTPIGSNITSVNITVSTASTAVIWYDAVTGGNVLRDNNDKIFPTTGPIIAYAAIKGTQGCISTRTKVKTGVWTYTYSGSPYSVALKAGNYTIEAWGAQGAKGQSYDASCDNPGKGGYVKADYSPTTNVLAYVYVGGQNGYNGGGTTTLSGGGKGTNGGGASDVRVGGQNISDRIIVAGGGGGGGSGTCSTYGGFGGHGGGASGLDGASAYGGNYGSGGKGATSTDGGAAGGTGNLNVGYAGGGVNSGVGASSVGGGGAGGGGYTGGGAGGSYTSCCAGGGGGGGSSYWGNLLNGSTITGSTAMPNPAGGVYAAGAGHIGHGVIKITPL